MLQFNIEIFEAIKFKRYLFFNVPLIKLILFKVTFALKN